MKFLTFVAEFIKHPKHIGAIAPSSKILAKKMVDAIDFEDAEYIVELGPGTGVFTKEIMKRKQKHTQFILIEINEVFARDLQKQFRDDPNVFVIHGSAEKLQTYMRELQIDSVDYILSGLPFTSLPMEVSSRILSNVMDVLQEHGEFITFQYSLTRKAFIQNFFPQVSVTKVWFNFPPAYVLDCRKEVRSAVMYGVT